MDPDSEYIDQVIKSAMNGSGPHPTETAEQRARREKARERAYRRQMRRQKRRESGVYDALSELFDIAAFSIGLATLFMIFTGQTPW